MAHNFSTPTRVVSRPFQHHSTGFHATDSSLTGLHSLCFASDMPTLNPTRQQQQQQQLNPSSAYPVTNNLDLDYLDHLYADVHHPYHTNSTGAYARNVAYPTPPLAMMQDNTRKRQRRQAAGNMVVNMFQRVGSATASAAATATANTINTPDQQKASAALRKKQSTAQPRPAVLVLPRGIGPVYEPNDNDVLSGRGGRINSHVGNVRFRDLVASKKVEYLDKNTKKLEKAHIAAQIVYYTRALIPPGRFLKEDPDGSWYDIGDAKAIKKVGQALREDAQEVRDGSGDDAEVKKDKKTKKKDKIDSSSDEEATKNKRNEVVRTTSSTTISPSITPRHSNAQMGKQTIPASFVNASPIDAPPLSKAATTLSPQKPVTVVSGRGGRISSPRTAPYAPMNRQHSPIAYRTVDIAPTQNYQSVLPPPPRSYPFYNTGSNSFRDCVPRTSGAAAAVMQQEHEPQEYEVPSLYQDEAFGRPFHTASQLDLSELSNSQVSGLSAVSALTDPASSMSAKSDPNLRRAQQLERMLHNWSSNNPTNAMLSAAAPGSSFMPSSDAATPLHMLHGSTGFGGSLNFGSATRYMNYPAQQHLHQQVLNNSTLDDSMNWAMIANNNSLLSGGVASGRRGSGSGSMLSGLNSLGSEGSMKYDPLPFMSSLSQPNFGASFNPLGSSSRHSVRSGNSRGRSYGGDNMSTSSSVFSMPDSAMSEISETLHALDLAGVEDRHNMHD